MDSSRPPDGGISEKARKVTQMKKFTKLLSLLMAVAMLFTLAACGGGGDTSQGGSSNDGSNNATSDNTGTDNDSQDTPNSNDGDSSANASDYKVAMITDYGDITDQSFNQTTYEACQTFTQANNLDFTYYKPTGDSTAERVAKVDAAVADGYNIVVMPGYAFAETLQEVVDLYPNVTFIALDVSPEDLPAGYTVPSNAYCAYYQEEIPGYLAGYAAVKLGYRHLGFLGGMAVPAVERYGYGYVQGVDAAAKELGIADQVTLEYVYGNQFYGDADITAYMDTWYKTKGVEVVFACGGSIYSSAAESAQNAGAKVIGVDVDQAGTIDSQYGEGMTVTSAMKGLAATVNNLLSEIVLNDNWAAYSGQVSNLGLVSATDLDSNYVGLPDSTQWGDGFSQDDYKALVADIYNGTITISNDTSAMPEHEITVNEYGNIK
jgi:basic membrane protein A